MKNFVVGHKNPDTDSVISAMIYSLYLKKMKIDAVPIILAKPNKETKFILDYFSVKSPSVISEIKAGKYHLVDHGGLQQSVPGLKEEDISSVVDHHQMFGLKTIEPIFYRAEPVGSTATLLFKMFKEKGWKLNKTESSLLLAGIISDTLYLTSKTTSKEDKDALRELNKLAKLDLKNFSDKMFEAKSDISGMSFTEVVTADYKDYDFAGKNICISVFETVSTKPFEGKEKEIIEIINKFKDKKKADLLFFGLVDILKKKTILYCSGEEELVVAKKAFKAASKNKSILVLPGVTSRKKELIPPLFKVL